MDDEHSDTMDPNIRQCRDRLNSDGFTELSFEESKEPDVVD